MKKHKAQHKEISSGRRLGTRQKSLVMDVLIRQSTPTFESFFIEEPLLVFANAGLSVDPKEGVERFGPYCLWFSVANHVAHEPRVLFGENSAPRRYQRPSAVNSIMILGRFLRFSPDSRGFLHPSSKNFKIVIASQPDFDKLRAPRHPEGWQDSMFADR